MILNKLTTEVFKETSSLLRRGAPAWYPKENSNNRNIASRAGDDGKRKKARKGLASSLSGISIQKLKLNNYSCCQKSINDDHLGQGGWILIPNETPDKLPPGFHLKWNLFFISDQILFFYCFVWEDLSKKGVRASSRVPNTYGLVLLSVFRCLEPVMKHLPSFLTYYIKHKFVIHCFMVCCRRNPWFLIIVGG